MTTKKIDPSNDLQAGLIRNLGLLQSKQSKKGGPSSLLDALNQEEQDTGRIDVGLSNSINSQLDPTKMAAERAEKVKKLKELIASGNYNPSSQDIAAAVGEELVMNILTAGDQSPTE